MTLSLDRMSIISNHVTERKLRDWPRENHVTERKLRDWPRENHVTERKLRDWPREREWCVTLVVS